MKKYRVNFNLRPESILLVLFIAGFVVGMVVAFLAQGEKEAGHYQWLNTFFLYLKYGEIHYGDILFYVLKKRCNLLFLIFLILMTGKGRYIFPFGGMIAGAFTGFYVTVFICCKGILGSGLFLATLFPHYICYAYAYYKLVLSCFGGSSEKKKIGLVGQYCCGENTIKSGMKMKKCAPIIVVIIGIITECYVNPFFLKIFLKFFM